MAFQSVYYSTVYRPARASDTDIVILSCFLPTGPITTALRWGGPTGHDNAALAVYG